jgi:hypothetical protein
MPASCRLSTPCVVLAAAVCAGGTAAPPALPAEAPIRLIVRGDDMGSSQASNQASIRFRDGLMRDVGWAVSP